MVRIAEVKSSIVFENNYTEITVAKKGALVEKIIDKKTKKDIKGEDTRFFSLHTREEEIPVDEISLKGDIITVKAENGSFDVEVKAFDNYFTFEIKTDLPEGTFKALIAHAKYDYDYTDKNNTGACNVSLTIWMNPVFYPDSKSCETRGEVLAHLGVKEAKLGLIIAPIVEQNAILKEAYLTVDRNKGIVSSTGGAWGRDSRLNFSNYTIQHDSSPEFIQSNLDFFKNIGVDQIDLHKGANTFRQGDFKFIKYDNGAEFKKHVSDVLEANGMTAGLHTYSFYITYDCETLLADPKRQKDLKVMASFTLAEDVSADADFFSTVESTDEISMDRGFCRTNSPMLLIDEELVRFDKDKNGMKITQRGCAGTKAVAHKKGATVKHLEGHYHGLTPIFGSELFLEVARLTAKAYNEGGFKMIYLDALDGIHRHCERGVEDWFYMAQFVCEVLKYCNCDPVLEGASFMPSMYAARGRIGASDLPYRGYKNWNNRHAIGNKNFIDRYNAPTLGWYNFYPMTDMYPGNEHSKYHHTDSIEHMGALAVAYDYSNVFNGIPKASLDRYAGMRRNIALYKKYDDLRKAQYFDQEYRQKLLDCPYEVQLKEKRGKKFTFVEKDYQIAKLFDLNDAGRNFGNFKNPFGAQVPFIRIEAMLSTSYNNPFVMLPLDETKDLITQKLEVKYGGEIDLSNNLAKVVKVCGNGIKGGKICIKVRCATNSESGYGEYIIDTDFKGWREYILLESDNGERRDHEFEKKEGLYPIYRSSLNNNRTTNLSVETEGDMTGVKMSSIIAYEHTYEILKNPTVKIGEMAIMFECELKSTDFIEFDGKTAKVVDRYGNEMPIWFTSNLKAPRGKFKAELTARALNRGTPRAQLTLGFTGKEIK
ncbi:MAG: hypothetical protein E7613_07005 [Ruminococcaceae bacterium]|nr:hypothetical protein [Oscillospiraceae bacterium]